MKRTVEDRAEFVAKTFTDMGKAVFVVGLASGFFEKFTMHWRIAITIFSVLFIGAGILMYPIGGEEE